MATHDPTTGEGLPPGPIDETPWPDTLPAHVVDEAGPIRVCGYDGGALAARGIAYAVCTALAGTAPKSAAAHALSVACAAVAARGPAFGPTHAAVLAHVAGSPAKGTFAVAAAALAEESACLVERLAPLLEHLGDPATPPPPPGPTSDNDAGLRRAVARALAAAGAPTPPDGPDRPLEELFAVACFHAGIRSPAAILVALCWARLPLACAEALAFRPGDFRSLPVDTPKVRYAPRNNGPVHRPRAQAEEA